ncbi:hypothetical protein KAR91_59710 [Candidatus Pacearchaeota archaeon]|nr:hypothetical protein [Candidatus Pacearchaeota archaeon]
MSEEQELKIAQNTVDFWDKAKKRKSHPKKLRNCPFCKAAGGLVDYGLECPNEKPMKYQVLCCGNEKGECHACGGIATSAEEAIRLWNTRADDERIKELEEEVGYLTHGVNHNEELIEARDVEIKNLEAENERLRKAQTWQPLITTPSNKKENYPFLVKTKNDEGDLVALQVSWFEGNLYPDHLAFNIDYNDVVKDYIGWMPLPPVPKEPTE